jgi:hypothetical protein
MSKFETQSDRVEQPAEATVALSAEEQEVLARIHKQTRSNLRKRLRRPPNDQPPSWFLFGYNCW